MSILQIRNAPDRPESSGIWLAVPALLLLAVFFIAPLLKLLSLSVADWSLEPYTRIWSDGI